MLQILTTTVLVGWPEQKKRGANYNQRILDLKRRNFLAQWNPVETPAHNRSIRQQIPRSHASHHGHLDIEACLRLVGDAVFWPGMNSEIKVHVCRISGKESERANAEVESSRSPLEPTSIGHVHSLEKRVHLPCGLLFSHCASPKTQ